MKGYVGVETLLYSLVNEVLDIGEWLASCLGRFTPKEKRRPYPAKRLTEWTSGPLWIFWTSPAGNGTAATSFSCAVVNTRFHFCTSNA
jgi:hypothetical protein